MAWRVAQAAAADRDDWFALRDAMWPQARDVQFEEIDEILARADHAGFLARDAAGRAVGFAEASLRHDYVSACETSPVGFLEGIYVDPPVRRQGVAKALLRECAADARARGAEHLSLEVLVANESAVAVWRRLGFEDTWLGLTTRLAALDRRLDEPERGEARATTHVQADDLVSVERATAQFIPRLEAVDVRANGSWIRVADPVLDRDRQAHGRFARELSDRLGAVTVALALEGEVVRFRLYERGRMVDEYLSVPTYYGELPKGDELALAANPTLVARLTGADREEVRRVARNDVTPAGLPPAPELYESIARMMGLEP